jgi:hypothetical protein
MKRAVISFFAGAAVTALIFCSTVVPAIKSREQHESAGYESQIKNLQQQIEFTTKGKVSWAKPAVNKSGCPTCQVHVSGNARLLDSEP